MSGGGETRVSIPNNVKETIQDIREITKKQHSDDEIYAVLKECSMDPNETAQKLLYLDTFHEVKRRKDRRKENLKGRASEDSRMPPGTQRRVSRGGGQGNYSSSISSDAGGGRNASARRENGVNHVADRGSMPSSVKPVIQKTKNIAATSMPIASTGTPNGVPNLSNGSSVHSSAPKSPTSVDNNVREGGSAIDAKKLGAAASRPAAVTSTPTFGSLDHEKPVSIPEQLPISAPPASASSVYSSASDPAVSNHVQENKKGSVDAIGLESSKSVKRASRSANSVVVAEKNWNIKPSQPHFSSNNDDSLAKLPSKSVKQSQLESAVPLKVVTLEVATNAVEATSQVPRDSSLSVAKHVTFPNHIQVPEALKNVLTFGSIDATFGPRVDSVNGTGGDIFSIGAVESSQDTDETTKEPSPSNDILSSRVQGDFSENPPSIPNVLEKSLPTEGNVSSSTDSKSELPKQESQLPPEGPQNQTALHAPSYNIGFFPPMLGSQLLQVEGHDNQGHETPRLPNFVGGNSAAAPSPNSTPPLPSSIPVSQQSVPLYRQTYPPNFYPYGHYLSPYYMPPIHQFLGHNGFPPQPSAGNVFLPPPPAAAAAGVKFPLPHFKTGVNAGNPTQYSIQSGGSFINTPGGYAPGSAVTSGSSVGNEDLGASQLKENHIYTTGQLTEGSTVWIHAPGQDMSSLQVSSMYNLPQGPRLTFSPMQAGHGGMAGIYPPGQTIASPTFLQQSQAVAGAAETIGPQSAAYQQPQHTQMTWN
ncbi:PREDICTED: GBF-interacting [Prunus dulcis]|uniref:PREDICTED: GBF-interacting n=1 Tax=Prunus dulcis TaxID=3755 RepID=A0A5E4ESQ4_PRUDU|nr:GBF-interacting protein 1-like [Prunus dulcis]VVA18787.1 PREDICTED: GBF-interacting [Prunus dulcis]